MFLDAAVPYLQMVRSTFVSASLILAATLPFVSAQSCGGPQYAARYGTNGTRSLRIANGGAGQSGLIGAWALKFIADSVKNGTEPFFVRWNGHERDLELKVRIIG